MQPQTPSNSDTAVPEGGNLASSLPPVAPMPVGNAVSNDGPAAFTAPIAADQPAQATPTAAPGNAPAMADDGDLIEKEWVSKVKQIVHQTANDPYEFNRQFTNLKADYMQKRYGKSIKLG